MGIKKGLTIGKVRKGLYRGAKILGDVNAVARGTVHKRAFNRATGWGLTRFMRWLSQALFGK